MKSYITLAEAESYMRSDSATTTPYAEATKRAEALVQARGGPSATWNSSSAPAVNP